jgi:two-component system sensor histidine kinase and response regulator WspE
MSKGCSTRCTAASDEPCTAAIRHNIRTGVGMSTDDVSKLSMLELFSIEAEEQSRVLVAGLLALERDPTAADQLEACMRAAHSLKGAARIVGFDAGVAVTHAMEDCFVSAQQGRLKLRQEHIDLLLGGVDLLGRMARSPQADLDRAPNANKPEVDEFVRTLTLAIQPGGEERPAGRQEPTRDIAPSANTTLPTDLAASADHGPSADIARSADVAPYDDVAQSADFAPSAGITAPAPNAPRSRESGNPERDSPDRMVRVTAENLNRLLGLAGESLVASRQLKPLADSLLRLKRLQHGSAQSLDALRERGSAAGADEQTLAVLDEIGARVLECERSLTEGLSELETFYQRATRLSRRLYDEAVACRMRPFADGVQAFPRMVRDVGRSLGKQVRLEVLGEATRVDRDVLEKLDAPLGHLLRNAVDHGIENPQQRRAAGKPEEGVVRLEARHTAGALQIVVSDDGQGMDLDKLRQAVVDRGLTTAAMARQLSDAELLEFLFLPGFTLKADVTEISGRGVGLDVVQNMVKQVRGMVRVSAQAGQGMRFQLQLPLTLSVVRTLLADIKGEAYAFPLAQIFRTLRVSQDDIELLEGRPHCRLDNQRIGLVSAHEVFSTGATGPRTGDLSVIVVGDHGAPYGVVVDKFLGERELVVQALDPRLGKIKDISAGALMEDGSPVLIVDVEDLLLSVQKQISAGAFTRLPQAIAGRNEKKRKRVLVVDDSLTVRELERKLLAQHGYEVEVAVDGMDGWNAVRTGHFDLLITDIDMPRMDGFELVTLVKRDTNLKSLPVMIVTYKDRTEDRRRGLEAGADYYLTKGSFHDETLLQAAIDLIGEAAA